MIRPGCRCGLNEVALKEKFSIHCGNRRQKVKYALIVQDFLTQNKRIEEAVLNISLSLKDDLW